MTMVDEMRRFTTAIDFSEHPMNNAKTKTKRQYYLALEYFVKEKVSDEFAISRLEQYKNKFIGNIKITRVKAKTEKEVLAIVNSSNQYWRRKYRYWLMCDIALILMDECLIDQAAREMQKFMTEHQWKKFAILLQALKDENKADYKSIAFANKLIQQYGKNSNFHKKKMRRFIVTATMSAGKSTLINAIIGKPLARTSQEVCTGNISYLYSKPFEDGCIHLKNGAFTFDASHDDLTNISWEYKSNIASFFRAMDETAYRLCIIDTPGVNSAINRQHGRISREALKNEQYEKVLYILNANKLGTDEEFAHLKWMSENIQKDKIIFILNKLDDFKAADDDIAISLDRVKNDLRLLGFDNPIICPMSAYFALLIKMKFYGYELSDDESDAYELYIKKFNRPMYDLSKYYDGIYAEFADNEAVKMSKRCGLYGLEKILFGGT